MRFYPRKLTLTNGLVREIQNIPVANAQRTKTDIYCVHDIATVSSFDYGGPANPWTIDGGGVTVVFTPYNLDGYHWKATYSTGPENFIKQLNPTVLHLYNASGNKTAEGVYVHGAKTITWATVAAPHGTDWVSVGGAGTPAASPTKLKVVGLFGATNPVEALISETTVAPLAALAIDGSYDTGFTHITSLHNPFAGDFSLRVEPTNGIAVGNSYSFYCHVIQSLRG
jgi:hypothetical protein